jgi:hypothetical protein
MEATLLKLSMHGGLVARFYLRDDKRIGLVVENESAGAWDEEVVALVFEMEELRSVLNAWEQRCGARS